MAKKSRRKILENKNIIETNEQIHENNDNSPIVKQRSKLKTPLTLFQRPLNDKQQEFLKIALDKNTKMVFLSGPAGTSKTYMSLYAAIELLNLKKQSDIIYIRSAVESSEKGLGYLPGEISEKLSPYLRPLYDKLDELLNKIDVDRLRKEDRVESIPVGFVRGANWNAKVIIVDEAQNMTFKELTTVITRIGEFSKMFICGDPMQSDINGKSGLKQMIQIFNDMDSKQNGIYTFEFDEEDIVRSQLVKFIIRKLKSEEN